MEKVNLNDYVVRYFSGKERYTGDENYSRNFFRHILNMPESKLPMFVKLRIFAKFFEEDHKRKGTMDFSFWDATQAIYDVLSEEKFI